MHGIIIIREISARRTRIIKYLDCSRERERKSSITIFLAQRRNTSLSAHRNINNRNDYFVHRETMSDPYRALRLSSTLRHAFPERERSSRGGDKRAREEKSAKHTPRALCRGGAHRGQRATLSARGEGEPVISSCSGYSAAWRPSGVPRVGSYRRSHVVVVLSASRVIQSHRPSHSRRSEFSQNDPDSSNDGPDTRTVVVRDRAGARGAGARGGRAGKIRIQIAKSRAAR